MPETLAPDLPADLDALSPLQERSMAHANARINLWTGSIRSGKTIASLLRWLAYVTKAPRGGALVVTGKTYDTVARNVFGPLADPAITGKLSQLVKYTRGASTATILGRQIEVITANDVKAEGRLRGLTCAGAYADEVSLLPEVYWDQLLGRMSVPGAKVFGTSNPDNPAHWLRQRFILRERELNLRHWHFTLDDNPSLPAEYVEAIKNEFVGLWYRRFVLGEWVAAEGAIFDMWDERRHVVDTLPTITHWISVGVDHGATNPFHAVSIGLGADGILYATSEWRYDARAKHRGMSDVEYSAELRDWMTRQRLNPEYVIVDPSAKPFRTQLDRDGIAVMKANNEVVDGIRTLGSLLHLGALKIHRSCEWLITELPGYSWDDEKALRGEDAPIKVADHGVDALRYALHTTRSVWRPMLRSDLSLAA
ncbi:PBSX family phage terminase large subunit [Glycomyces sp. NPDC046736]|uniref:PBSX family phage terminase large subunit n=1 Tax=Glycomyces sp. NPDC046736 TaxID=3155615 RepID=UPI0033FB1E25